MWCCTLSCTVDSSFGRNLRLSQLHKYYQVMVMFISTDSSVHHSMHNVVYYYLGTHILKMRS